MIYAVSSLGLFLLGLTCALIGYLFGYFAATYNAIEIKNQLNQGGK